MQKINETQWRRVCKESKRIEREDRKCKVEQRQTIKKNYCFSDLLGHLNPFLTFPFNSSSGLFSSFVRSFLPLLSLSLFLCAHFKPISSWEIFVVDFISTFLLLYGFCIVFIFIRNCCHYFLFGLVRQCSTLSIRIPFTSYAQCTAHRRLLSRISAMIR